MPEITNQKRPTSHRWAIGFFGFITLNFIATIFEILSASLSSNPPVFGQHQEGSLMIFSLGFLALTIVTLGRHDCYAYYIGSIVLAIFTLRWTYNTFWYVNFANTSSPRPASGGQLFAVHRFIPFGVQLWMITMVVFMGWLFISFTFGRPSRRYYGFDKAEDAV